MTRLVLPVTGLLLAGVLTVSACSPLKPLATARPEATITVSPETVATGPSPTADSTAIDGPVSPGASGRIAVSVDGREREFLLHVPEGYSADQDWPLVLVFHGWQEKTEALETITRLDSAAALVAYAEGIDGAWAPAPYASTTTAEDLAYSEAVIATVGNLYEVDTDSVALVGFSNGGGFATTLACHIPERIAGLATVAAAYYEKVHEDCTQTPVAHIDLHGSADQVIGYYGGMRHESVYNSVEDVLEDSATRNRCSGPVGTTRETTGTLSLRWSGCEKPLEHIRIGGGGHVWPGGVKDPDPELPEGYATYRILRFFGINWTEWKGS